MKNKKNNVLGAYNYYPVRLNPIKLEADQNQSIRAFKLSTASGILLVLLLLPFRLSLIYFINFIKSLKKIPKRINVPGTAHGKMYKRGHV